MPVKKQKLTEIRNAKIRSASIQIEDHGMLTAWLDLDLGGSYQGFGGYGFDYRPKKERIFQPTCGHFIRRCLEIADVTDWERLPGKTVRIRKNGGWNEPITAIGHIVNDDWFEPKVEFEKYNKE